MIEALEERIEQFREEYLETPPGQKHLATAEQEAEDVKKVFSEIKRKHEAGKDITDDVLYQLLPYSDTKHNRAEGHRVSTWPCITKDVKTWFEGAGWKQAEDWPETARMIFEAIDGVVNNDKAAWDRFVNSKYRFGFGTGFISPILFCLDSQYPVINSKVTKTYKYCMGESGQKDEIDAKLVNYFDNVVKVKELFEQLEPHGLVNITEFDIFCHFMVSKKLGGGDLTVTNGDEGKEEPEYVAWLFVANPNIFMWDQAFEENGVDWTGSRGKYPQKLIREKIKVGDRVFGYQAGPYYEVSHELKVVSKPYRTAQGSWAINLEPVRKLQNPISFSTLKNHKLLSSIKFVQQTQISISGITTEQLKVIEGLTAEPGVVAEISIVDRLCQEIEGAQYDTSNPDRLEELLAEAFEFLGFEAEHVGGAGKADVVVKAMLGSDTYSAVVDAKTCKKESLVGSVNYQSVNDHREENTADFALIVGPRFAGGKIIDHALKSNVSLATTDVLMKVMRQHDRFPYSLVELRRLFEQPGMVAGLESKMSRFHVTHDEYIQLTNSVLQFFDEFQRQRETSSPITSAAIHMVLLYRAQQAGISEPTHKQVEEVLALLSNKILDVLKIEDEGYVLTLSLSAAKKRIEALGAVLSDAE